MKHRIESYWDMARLNEELDGAVAAVRYLEGRPYGSRAQARLLAWRSYEHALRNRMTAIGLGAELDALESK